jgi:DNA polymerase-3 subunit chi
VTTIDFYFNAADPLQVACRLAAKAIGQKKRMLVHAPDAELATRIDRMLWTWPAIGFVPHCAVHDPLAAETPVLIGSGEESPSDCQVLLNLGPQCPPHFERFDRLLEVVGAGEDERKAGRERYKFYLERGYKIANHDLAKAGETEGSQPNE